MSRVPETARWVRALSASVLAHGLVVLGFVAPGWLPSVEVDLQLESRVDWVDVELAPSAPAAFQPNAEPPAAVPGNPVPEPEEDTVAVADVSPPPDSPAEGTIDAGAPTAAFDAGAALRDAGPMDADPMDAGAVAALDGGSDAGAAIAMGDAGAADAGAMASAATDAGPRTATDAAQTDFAPHHPGGDVISVLLRLDRLRSTPWVEDTEAILEPMPDYRMIIGNRKLRAVDLFDSLFITSTAPSKVSATTLVAQFKGSDADMRAFVDHPGSPVSWEQARGGPKGTRTGGLMAPDDKRVYLMPHSGWIVLARPKYFGPLVKSAPAGVLAPAAASAADAPEWVKRIPSLPEQAGAEGGPFAVVTAQGIKGKVTLPEFVAGTGQLPVPRRLTVTLELDPKGFLVRGAAYFDDPKEARAFMEQAESIKKTLVEGFFGRRILANYNALNAVRGLTMTRNEATVAYVTSMSVSDSKAFLAAAARWTRAYFGGYGPPGGR